jgi:citrate synthase
MTREYPWTQADRTPKLDQEANEAGIAAAEEAAAHSIVTEIKQGLIDRWPNTPAAQAAQRTMTAALNQLYDDQYEIVDEWAAKQARRAALETKLGMKIEYYSEHGSGPVFRVQTEAEAYKAAYLFRLNRVRLTKSPSMTEWKYCVMVFGPQPPTKGIQ